MPACHRTGRAGGTPAGWARTARERTPGRAPRPSPPARRRRRRSRRTPRRRAARAGPARPATHHQAGRCLAVRRGPRAALARRPARSAQPRTEARQRLVVLAHADRHARAFRSAVWHTRTRSCFTRASRRRSQVTAQSGLTQRRGDQPRCPRRETAAQRARRERILAATLGAGRHGRLRRRADARGRRALRGRAGHALPLLPVQGAPARLGHGVGGRAARSARLQKRQASRVRPAPSGSPSCSSARPAPCSATRC